MNILGISAHYHDSAAALVQDGKLIAAAQEERFTRKKHDAGFPQHAIEFCLRAGRLPLSEIDYVAFYDRPSMKFRRLLSTYLSYAPRGLGSYLRAMPLWLRDKLYQRSEIRARLATIAEIEPHRVPPVLCAAHHQSHAASAFFPSPFEQAAVLCMDGVGEWATTSAWSGEGASLTPLWEIRFPHSIGLLYSAFTFYTGFRVNSGEYKLMGLAPYGEPRYVDVIRERLIDIKDDGSFQMDMRFFSYADGQRMTSDRFDKLFDGPPRAPDAPVTQREMDLARSIQVVTEEVVLRLARTLRRETGARHLCMAGGVALNCVANGRLLREGGFDDLWIQPAAGDAGGALGAAFAVWHQYLDRPRAVLAEDGMDGSFLGPCFHASEIRAYLESVDAVFQELDDELLLPEVARLLDQEQVVGWFQGKMEFGPRALGGRSILGDPRSEQMQSVMNLKIKFRESFRPFAPSVLAKRAADCFDLSCDSPYMLLVAEVKKERRKSVGAQQASLFGIDQLKVSRSDLPAITHVDYTARVQTVHEATNPRYHRLLEAFENRTGCPVLVNTSFNVRGEPIVCTPEDAYRCFMRTEMDALVIENFMLLKHRQPRDRIPGLADETFAPD